MPARVPHLLLRPSARLGAEGDWFCPRCAEEEEGANLTSAEALSVARLAAAGGPWAVDFGVWAFACSFGDERKVRTP